MTLWRRRRKTVSPIIPAARIPPIVKLIAGLDPEKSAGTVPAAQCVD